MAESDFIFLGIGGPGGDDQIDAYILFGLTDGDPDFMDSDGGGGVMLMMLGSSSMYRLRRLNTN